MIDVSMREQDSQKQKSTLDALLPRSDSLIKSIPLCPSGMITAFWEEKLKQMAVDFCGGIPQNFLQNGVITWTMCAGWQAYHETESAYIKSMGVPKELIIENEIGCPTMVNKYGVQTSANTVHHAYHLARYQAETKNNLNALKSVFEWGGGYGSMARLVRRILPDATIVVVDTGIFSVIEWLFLSSILGEDKVNLIQTQNDEIMDGKINLVPLSLLRKADGFVADLFLSTWAISESTKECQDHIVKQNAYGAKKFLLAHQGKCEAFPFAESLKQISGDSAKELPIEHLPGNYYLFA